MSGIIYGIRDATHRRLMDEGVEPPVSFEDQVVFHTAPSVSEVDGHYTVISTGPTTSARVENYIPAMLRKFHIRAIMGKGGLYRQETMDAMRENSCVYLGMVGGTAALTTAAITAVEGVYWKDLFPECIWKLRVERLGPMIVGLDAHGQNLYTEVQKSSQFKIDSILG
jgi:tartrate/fumarate subfamily iron-sulfur-dependent hydro-lyase beta chain